MEKIVFGMAGAGWRSEFFLRIAMALPEQFQICGILVRNEERGREVQAKWGIPTYTDIGSLVDKAQPAFMVVSLPWNLAPVITFELAKKGVPVLSETPPAPDLEGLIELNKLSEKGARIQVAEQYQFQPLHAARISIANSGKLGSISQAQVSVCHGYHGMSLIRKLMGIRYENAVISGHRFVSPMVDGIDKWGQVTQERTVNSQQAVAWMDFGDRLGIYDFADEQYFSWFRSQRLHVRGDRGEITDERIRYLKDYKTPVEFDLKRMRAGDNGNLEGYFLKGILAGEEWIYTNPFSPGRLTDDEVAIATCLWKMDQYAKGGPEFYALAEASQDHYLSLMVNRAVQTGETLRTQTQPWANG